MARSAPRFLRRERGWKSTASSETTFNWDDAARRPLLCSRSFLGVIDATGDPSYGWHLKPFPGTDIPLHSYQVKDGKEQRPHVSVHNATSIVETTTQVKNDEKIATTHDLAQCSLSRLTTNQGNKNSGEPPRIGGARLNNP